MQNRNSALEKSKDDLINNKLTGMQKWFFYNNFAKMKALIEKQNNLEAAKNELQEQIFKEEKQKKILEMPEMDEIIKQLLTINQEGVKLQEQIFKEDKHKKILETPEMDEIIIKQSLPINLVGVSQQEVFLQHSLEELKNMKYPQVLDYLKKLQQQDKDQFVYVFPSLKQYFQVQQQNQEIANQNQLLRKLNELKKLYIVQVEVNFKKVFDDYCKQDSTLVETLQKLELLEVEIQLIKQEQEIESFKLCQSIENKKSEINKKIKMYLNDISSKITENILKDQKDELTQKKLTFPQKREVIANLKSLKCNANDYYQEISQLSYKNELLELQYNINLNMQNFKEKCPEITQDFIKLQKILIPYESFFFQIELANHFEDNHNNLRKMVQDELNILKTQIDEVNATTQKINYQSAEFIQQQNCLKYKIDFNLFLKLIQLIKDLPSIFKQTEAYDLQDKIIQGVDHFLKFVSSKIEIHNKNNNHQSDDYVQELLTCFSLLIILDHQKNMELIKKYLQFKFKFDFYQLEDFKKNYLRKIEKKEYYIQQFFNFTEISRQIQFLNINIKYNVLKIFGMNQEEYIVMLDQFKQKAFDQREEFIINKFKEYQNNSKAYQINFKKQIEIIKQMDKHFLNIVYQESQLDILFNYLKPEFENMQQEIINQCQQLKLLNFQEKENYIQLKNLIKKTTHKIQLACHFLDPQFFIQKVECSILDNFDKLFLSFRDTLITELIQLDKSSIYLLLNFFQASKQGLYNDYLLCDLQKTPVRQYLTLEDLEKSQFKYLQLSDEEFINKFVIENDIQTQEALLLNIKKFYEIYDKQMLENDSDIKQKIKNLINENQEIPFLQNQAQIFQVLAYIFVVWSKESFKNRLEYQIKPNVQLLTTIVYLLQSKEMNQPFQNKIASIEQCQGKQTVVAICGLVLGLLGLNIDIQADKNLNYDKFKNLIEYFDLQDKNKLISNYQQLNSQDGQNILILQELNEGDLINQFISQQCCELNIDLKQDVDMILQLIQQRVTYVKENNFDSPQLLFEIQLMQEYKNYIKKTDEYDEFNFLLDQMETRDSFIKGYKYLLKTGFTDKKNLDEIVNKNLQQICIHYQNLKFLKEEENQKEYLQIMRLHFNKIVFNEQLSMLLASIKSNCTQHYCKILGIVSSDNCKKEILSRKYNINLIINVLNKEKQEQ